MTTALHSEEQRVVLHDISWDLYEALLCAHLDRSVPRFTYDRGELEIMSPSPEHDQIKETVTLLINIVAEETGVNAMSYGSTTFRVKDRKRGFEPDACFYIDNLPRIHGKKVLDLRIDPPPDLVIEVDITRSSIDKLSIMAEFGVPEVWLYGKKGWRILRLGKGTYVEQPASKSFPLLTPESLTALIKPRNEIAPLAWMRHVREWVRKAIS